VGRPIANSYGEPLPDSLCDVNEKHLHGDGPPHPDRATEIRILRWALGYNTREPDPWSRGEVAR
jgi:hypothetical protein